MSAIYPEELGFYFNQEKFEEIYFQTVKGYQDVMPLNQFKKEAAAFHEGTGDFKLFKHNQLEPGVKRYSYVDNQTMRMITAAFSNERDIVGLQFGMLEKFNTDYIYTEKEYVLPFRTEWFVLWGGSNNFWNYHYPHESQRYAYDFIVKKDGRPYEGSGERLNDHYGYGEAVTAPGTGTVVKVYDGVADNAPFSMNMEQPEGNAIVIKHGEAEYSLLAHLKEGSILVSEGSEVRPGDLIAACGNSGASDTPHLHFHVMDAPIPEKGLSIRIRFAELNFEPKQGDTLRGE